MVAADLSDAEVLRLRMHAQRLCGQRARSVRDVLREVTAIQAQDTRASRLSVRARGESLDVNAVIRACNDERSVVRTWTMRGTLHMVPSEDVGWMVALLGPREAAGYRRRRLELGLDDETCERALTATRGILARECPLTRSELVARLADQGVRIDPKTQAPAHLVLYAGMTGLICRGPDREDDEPTYVLLESWVGKQIRPGGDRDMAELARRYIGAYGPAGAEDFAHWAGISRGEAWRGLQSISNELQEVEVQGEQAWVLATADLSAVGTSEPCVRLLPAFDTYLLGYRNRDLALDPKFSRRIHAGGGWIHPAIVVDGRVVGSWRAQLNGDALTVTAQPFEKFDRKLLPHLEAEADEVGRFLGLDAGLVVG